MKNAIIILKIEKKVQTMRIIYHKDFLCIFMVLANMIIYLLQNTTIFCYLQQVKYFKTFICICLIRIEIAFHGGNASF